jgi:predicted RNA-binding protein with PUA-like domain
LVAWPSASAGLAQHFPDKKADCAPVRFFHFQPVSSLAPPFIEFRHHHHLLLPVMPGKYWLFKSEPDVFSFEDLKLRPGRTEPWTGVRNYQARNFMRDAMKPGDLALFYHSSCPEPGVAGVVRVAGAAYPDSTQFDPASEYFDPKSQPSAPRWMMVDVTWEADLPQFVSLDRLRSDPALGQMVILRRGNRLSITPVTRTEFQRILQLGAAAHSSRR